LHCCLQFVIDEFLDVKIFTPVENNEYLIKVKHFLFICIF